LFSFLISFLALDAPLKKETTKLEDIMSKEREIGVDLAKQEKFDDALFFLETAFYKGDISALNDMGVVFERKKNYEVAMKLYQQTSMLGSGVATFNAANLFEKGKGTEQDSYFSYLLYKKSTDQKCAEAFYKLSKYYQNGIVVKKDDRKAFELVKKGTKLEAKSKEDSACFVTVGYFYEAGIGTKQNFKKAFKYYMKAVKKGSSLGMYNAALCLLYRSNKKNIRKNARKGIELLVEATKKNYADAFAELATIYREGKFVTKDLDMSDYWLTEAMKKKSWKALLIYADICLSGENPDKKIDIQNATLTISTFLGRPSEYFDDYKDMYENLKNEYKDLLDWESMEKNPSAYSNSENKDCAA
jgi:TPR repeat protein